MIEHTPIILGLAATCAILTLASVAYAYRAKSLPKLAPFQRWVEPSTTKLKRNVARFAACFTLLICGIVAGVAWNIVNVPVWFALINLSFITLLWTTLKPEREPLWQCSMKTLHYEIPMSAYSTLFKYEYAVQAGDISKPALDTRLRQIPGVLSGNITKNLEGDRAYVVVQIMGLLDKPALRTLVERYITEMVEEQDHGKT